MTLVVILNTPHDTISQRMAQHTRQVRSGSRRAAIAETGRTTAKLLNPNSLTIRLCDACRQKSGSDRLKQQGKYFVTVSPKYVKPVIVMLPRKCLVAHFLKTAAHRLQFY